MCPVTQGYPGAAISTTFGLPRHSIEMRKIHERGCVHRFRVGKMPNMTCSTDVTPPLDSVRLNHDGDPFTSNYNMLLCLKNHVDSVTPGGLQMWPGMSIAIAMMLRPPIHFAHGLRQCGRSKTGVDGLTTISYFSRGLTQVFSCQLVRLTLDLE